MKVDVVKLPPMRVASFHAKGTSPEQAAWDQLIAWAKPLGILKDPGHRLFGFDNPCPSHGNPEYGYEAWIQVDDDLKDENVNIKDFPGGDYLVTRVEVPKGRFEVIGQGWRDLVAWRKQNGYRCADAQCLEESVRTDRQDLEFILDLHLAVEV